MSLALDEKLTELITSIIWKYKDTWKRTYSSALNFVAKYRFGRDPKAAVITLGSNNPCVSMTYHAHPHTPFNCAPDNFPVKIALSLVGIGSKIKAQSRGTHTELLFITEVPSEKSHQDSTPIRPSPESPNQG